MPAAGEVGGPGDQAWVAAIKPLMEGAGVDRRLGSDERFLRGKRSSQCKEKQGRQARTSHGRSGNWIVSPLISLPRASQKAEGRKPSPISSG